MNRVTVGIPTLGVVIAIAFTIGALFGRDTVSVPNELVAVSFLELPSMGAPREYVVERVGTTETAIMRSADPPVAYRVEDVPISVIRSGRYGIGIHGDAPVSW